MIWSLLLWFAVVCFFCFDLWEKKGNLRINKNVPEYFKILLSCLLVCLVLF